MLGKRVCQRVVSPQLESDVLDSRSDFVSLTF